MRWMPALLLCGCLALVAAVAFQSPQSLAMQNGSPTPPSDPARAFCPEDQEIPFTDESIFEPTAAPAGSVSILNFPVANPTPGAEQTGQLYLTNVTLPAHSCILGSYFFPGAVITVMSGQVEIFIEHWPGNGDPPVALLSNKGTPMPVRLGIGTPAPVAELAWVRIEKESFVGFKNVGDTPAKFTVAGLKPDGDPGGGGCGGGCRGRP